MADLSIQGLCVNYLNKDGEVQVLKGADLHVHDGEFVALSGVSGAGKTTLLKVCAGLLPYHDGDIFLDGEDVDRMPIKKRNVAYISQQHVLYPHLTLFDNIALPLKKQRKSPDYIYKRVGQLAEIVGMREFLSRKPHQISEGQQQCIALAKNLAKDASVYLFDEPFSALDAVLRNKLEGYLKAEQQNRHLTIILATHDILSAEKIADVMYVVRDGKIFEQWRRDSDVGIS